MKRITSILTMMLLCLCANAQVERCISVVDDNGYNASFLVSNIERINYILSDTTGRYVQEIYSNGRVYSKELSQTISTLFDNIDVSEICVSRDSIGDWDELRLAADGSMCIRMDDIHNPEYRNVVMILPDSQLGAICYSITLDENDMPKYIAINETVIRIDGYDNETIDLTVAYNDSIIQSLNGLTWQSPSAKVTRGWANNNWQRNTAGVIELASGVVGVAVGAIMVTGSVVSEAGTLGASTPISIPGIAAGVITIQAGRSSFVSGYEKLFGAKESRSNVLEGIAYQTLGEVVSNERLLNLVPQEYFAYLKDPNYFSSLNSVSRGNFVVGLSAGILDTFWGKTVTWEDIVEFYKGKVLTGVCTDITSSSVKLKGYVYPEVTRSPLNGKKNENEYGIIVNDDKGNSSRYQKVQNGDGGIVEFTFDNLESNTQYTYRAYFYDKTNTIFQQGEIKTFKTQGEFPKITSFKQTCSHYSPGEYYNDGRYYDYKYDVATTVTIESLVGVSDWGYVYRDPYGNIKHISLMGIPPLFTDTRYAYYRNEAKSTACLYGYVKYQGDSEYYYDDPQEYPLEHSVLTCPDDHHPHAIDLGLPSGTKWACCNVGASSPEQYGGYYAWGETSEKSYYDWDTYAYLNDNTGCINIGTDIAGTQYDVAHVRMGGSWRMPSHEQQIELINNCNRTWTNPNGVNGILVTGPSGGQIFLPAAGLRWNDDHKYISDGFYWSSSLYPDDDYGAYCFFFGLNYWDSDYWEWDDYGLNSGLSVRAVCP